MNVGRAITKSMEAQRERDFQTFQWSASLLTHEQRLTLRAYKMFGWAILE